MATDRTRTAILTAAEQLYAERGFSEVTLRDIVAAAGVNLAAVNYHFGSKDNLVNEVFRRRMDEMSAARLNQLEQALGHFLRMAAEAALGDRLGMGGADARTEEGAGEGMGEGGLLHGTISSG